MKVIHKYRLTPQDNRLEVELPGSARVVFVDSQKHGVVHFWVEINPDAELHKRTFVLYGTGNVIDDNHYYVGSVNDPPFVWHLYEEWLDQETGEEE